jgi:hypothetical protein
MGGRECVRLRGCPMSARTRHVRADALLRPRERGRIFTASADGKKPCAIKTASAG